MRNDNLMDIQILLNILTYTVGVVSWIYLYKQHSFLRKLIYGYSAHLIAIVAISFTTNHLFPTYMSTFAVLFSVLFLGIVSIFFAKTYTSPKTRFNAFDVSDTITLSIMTVLVVAFVTNIIMSSRLFFYIPTIGNNDDTATHLGMSVMAIKDNSLLFKNDILEGLISKGIDYQNARYYPPSVYTYLAHIYEVFRPEDSSFIDLPVLMNIYGAFSFLIFLIFIYSIFDLALGIVKSVNLWAYTPLLIFGLFFVAGEYFVMLYRMSYLTQLLGNAFVLMFFRTLIDAFHSKDPRAVTPLSVQTQLGMLLMGVGLTYYLFLPIVIVGLVFAISRQGSDFIFMPKSALQVFKHNSVLLISALVSVVPFLLYIKSYSLIEQITIPGINLITLASLIQFCLMVLVFVVLRRYFKGFAYKVVLVGFLTSLFLAIMTLNPSSIRSGELPYYFFKSFFTSASFAVAFGAACISIVVSHTSRYFHRHNAHVGFLVQSLLWIAAPLAFVAYLYSYNTLVPGYKSITYIARASLNYYQPSVVKKLYSLYDSYHDQKIAVYNPGYWGENILLYALFENIPSIHVEGTKKKIFYFSSNPEFYMQDMVRSSGGGKDLYMFDGHGSFKPRMDGLKEN